MARRGSGSKARTVILTSPPCPEACHACLFPAIEHRALIAQLRGRPRPLSSHSLPDLARRLPHASCAVCSPAGDYRALIVSDVAARGLDIPECDAVFHLELPTDAAHYAHRAGRTGRWVLACLGGKSCTEWSCCDYVHRQVGAEALHHVLASRECACPTTLLSPLPSPCVCLPSHYFPCRAGRHGRVISLVSGGERHVVHKLTQRLGVPVTELEVSHGEIEERDVAAAEAAGAPRAPGAAQERPPRRQQQEQRGPAAGQRQGPAAGEQRRQRPAVKAAPRQAKPWESK